MAPVPERLVDRFRLLSAALSNSSLFLLLLFPGLTSVFCLLHDLWHMVAGPSGAEPDFLEAGGGQPFSRLLIRLLAGLALVGWLMERRSLRSSTRAGNLWSALCLGVLVLSSAHSEVPGEAWPATLSMGMALAMYWLVLERVGDERIRRLVPQLVALSGGMAGWAGLCMFGLFKLDNLTGGFYQQNVMAGYTVLVMPLTLACWADSGEWTWLACAVGEGGALLLTFSRAGWLACLAVSVLFGVAALRYGVSRRTWRGLAVGVLLSWTIFSGLGAWVSGQGFHVIPRHAVERAENSTHADVASVMARRAFYRGAWHIWLEHPLLGIGLDAFNRYYPQQQEDFRWYSRYSHSLYLDALSETGVLGAAAFAVFILWSFRSGLYGHRPPARAGGAQTWRKAGLVQSGLALGLLGSLVHSTVDFDWKFDIIPMTFLVLAACLVVPAVDAPPAWRGPGAGQLLASMAVLVVCALSIRVWVGDHEQLVGELFLGHDRVDDAAVHLETSLANNPWQSDTCNLLVDVCRAKGDLAAATRYADQSVTVDPHRAVNWDRVAQVAIDQKDMKLAWSAEQHALQLDAANFPDFYNRLATIADSSERPREALRYWREAERRFPWDQVQQIQPFRQDALRPQILNTFKELGTYLMAHGDLPGAIDAFQHELAIDPNDTDALMKSAQCYLSLQQFDKALAPALAAQRLQPQDAQIDVFLAVCYQHLGRSDDAQKALEKAFQLDPSLRSQTH